MGRAPCCDKANVKRGPWSPEEDSKLKDYITKHGTGGNWIALPQKAGLKRCGKSCRLRWLNYLRPNIKHGDFTDEEDRVICTLFATIGSRWSIIAAQLPGRTDNDIKNYWNTKLKKKLMAMAAPPSTHQYTSSSHHRKITSPIYHHDQASPLLSSSPISTVPKNPPTSNFSYYNYTPSTIPPKPFTCFQPNVSHLQLSDQLNHLSNNSISSLTPESPQLQYNHTNFPIYGGGSEPSLLSTINSGIRSHHDQIKQEVISGQMSFGQLQHLRLISSDHNNITAGCEETHKSFIPAGDHGAVESHSINLNQYWAADQEAVSEVDYELEHFKHLIDCSSSSNSSFFNVDESKSTKQEVMFYN